MGREIRRVIPHWEHPKRKRFNALQMCDVEEFQPLFDESYSAAMSEWIEQHQLWERGEHPDQKDGSGKGFRYYAQWNGNPPDVEYFRPDWKPEEATWWQVYETVSEGTPVSPPFATREELVEYLVANGDFWDQHGRANGRDVNCAPWSRRAAERFVFGAGWAPSFVSNGHGLKSGVEALADES